MYVLYHRIRLDPFETKNRKYILRINGQRDRPVSRWMSGQFYAVGNNCSIGQRTINQNVKPASIAVLYMKTEYSTTAAAAALINWNYFDIIRDERLLANTSIHWWPRMSTCGCETNDSRPVNTYALYVVSVFPFTFVAFFTLIADACEERDHRAMAHSQICIIITMRRTNERGRERQRGMKGKK